MSHMRKLMLAVALLALVIGARPLTVTASPVAQFAGCADELDEEYGARFVLTSLNGLNFTLTAVGVEDFDPTITVLDQEGEVVACNDNAEEAAAVAVVLPEVEAGPSEGAARVDVRVPGDQGRFDYEVIVGSADDSSGEFVLFYQGAEVFGSDNVDKFMVKTNEGQTTASVPLGLYALNLKRPEIAVDLEVSFTFGDTTQTCQDSSSTSLCEGESTDLTGFTVTLEEGEDAILLNGDDAMLYYELGGEPGEFEVGVGSDGKASFGAYTLLFYSGVGYPEQ
jgi:hypothetical protein